jgi:hypothetical protein
MANTRRQNRNGLIDTVRSTITQLGGNRGRNTRGGGLASRATGMLGGLIGGGGGRSGSGGSRGRSAGTRRRRRR